MLRDEEKKQRLLSEQEAASFMGFTPRTLQAWRYRGGGPEFVRISSRAIRYRFEDLSKWLEERICSNTSAKKKEGE